MDIILLILILFGSLIAFPFALWIALASDMIKESEGLETVSFLEFVEILLSRNTLASELE